jgi:hypothetical protein
MTDLHAVRPRILITGSRDWTDRVVIQDALYETWVALGQPRDAILVQGEARGADKICKEVWNYWQFPVESHPADWSTYGRRAGTLRNEKMVALGATVCLAFPLPQSIGTFHCMRIARRAGIPVKDYGTKAA